MTPDWLLQLIMLAISVLAGSAVFYCLSQECYHWAIWVGFSAVVLLALVIALFLRNEVIKKGQSAASSQTHVENILQMAEPDSLRKEFVGEAEELVNKAESYFKASVNDYEERRLQDAIKNCEKSINTLPSIPAYLNLSAYLTYTSDHKKTEDVFSKGIQLAQKRGDTKSESAFLSNRGSYYGDRGQQDKAMLDFLKAIELDPINPFPHFNLAVDYCHIHLYDMALDELQQFEELNKRVRVRELEGKGTRLHNLRGEIKNGQGLYKEAILEFNKAIQANSKFVAAYNNRGMSYLRQGYFDLSISDFDKTIELDPKFAGGYSNRGDAYAAKGLFDKGISDCNTAIKLNPRHVPAYLIRGRIYGLKELYDRAILDFNKVLEINPREARAYLLRGEANKLKGNDDKALSDFNTAIDINPNYAEAYFRKAKLLLQKNMTDDSLLNYDKAIKINPLYADALIDRGVLYINKDKLDNALADLDKAIKINPNSDKAYNNRGIVYFRQELFDNALSDFNKAIQLNPDYANALFNRGKLLKHIGQSRKSDEDFSKACSLGLTEACGEYEALTKRN